MTEDELKAIRERAEKATPGPWVISTGKRGFGIGSTIFEGSEQGRVIMQSAEMGASVEQYRADCLFCAHAREDIPALLAEVESLRTNLAVECETTAHLSARIAELEEALQQQDKGQ